MSSFTLIVFCIQACLFQSIFGLSCLPCPVNPRPSNSGYGGVILGGSAGSGQTGYGVPSTAGSSGYSGSGFGYVSVLGDMPVNGNSYIQGTVPVVGVAEFYGTVPAVGSVQISGSCVYGCECY